MLYLHKNYNYIIKIKGLDELTSFALDFSIVKKSFFMMSPKWGSHQHKNEVFFSAHVFMCITFPTYNTLLLKRKTFQAVKEVE